MKKETALPSTVDARTRFGALVASGALRACERHVAGAHDQDERVQEGLAMTYVWYSKQIALGRVPELALIRHCCKCRTVDRSHRFAPCDGARWSRDVYCMQGRNGVELRRLQLIGHQEDRVEEDEALGLAEAGCQDPTEKLDSALDLGSWLAQLSADDRILLAMKQAGYGLEAIAKRLRATSSTVWKHGQELGCELAERAGVTIEKKRRQRLPRGLPPAVCDAIAVTQ